MSFDNTDSTDGVAKPKRKQIFLTITEKMKVLEMRKEGQTSAAIARHFGVHKDTIQRINKAKERIRRTSDITFNTSAKRVVSSYYEPLILMEAALVVWIEDCRKKNTTLDRKTVKTKAVNLYESFTHKEADNRWGSNKNRFSASPVWLWRFLKRYDLQDIFKPRNAASANTKATKTCVNITSHSLREYQHGPVSNMGGNGMPTSGMPSRTFTFQGETKASGFRAHMSPDFYLTACNAKRTLSKSALIFASKISRALKHMNMKVVAVPTGWTMEQLAHVLNMSKQLKEHSQKWDDNMERSVHFRNKMDEVMNQYELLYNQKAIQQRQPLITMYFQLIEMQQLNG